MGKARPWWGTLAGVGLGVLAVAFWMITFEPHGVEEWSRCLFPLSAWLLARLYPNESPVPHWYAGALLHWIVPGLLIDRLRRIVRNHAD
jgi:hypothetical protein